MLGKMAFVYRRDPKLSGVLSPGKADRFTMRRTKDGCSTSYHMTPAQSPHSVKV